MATSLGNVPVLLGDDFNGIPQYSHILRTLEASGQWIDAAKVWAAATGAQPQNTCFPVHGKASRTDILIVNQVAAAALSGVSLHEESGLTPHKPISFAFRWGATQQKVPTLVARLPFPIPAGCEASFLNGLAEDAWAEQRLRWEQLLRDQDAERLWDFCSRGNASYLTRCRNGSTSMIGKAYWKKDKCWPRGCALSPPVPRVPHRSTEPALLKPVYGSMPLGSRNNCSTTAKSEGLRNGSIGQ